MDEELRIRDIPDWGAFLPLRSDTPFLTRFADPFPAIGEKNRYGQTYLGMSEPVDPEERAFAQGMMNIYRDILDACGDDAWTYDEESDRVPAGNLEGMIAEWADVQLGRWRSIERQSGPQEMWEGERIPPKKMTWGMGIPGTVPTQNMRIYGEES